jgi:hypothetical protein
MGMRRRRRKEYFQKTSPTFQDAVLNCGMRIVLDRAVLTVTRREGVWRVEAEGEPFGHSKEKEVAKAAAHRRAREMLDAGRPCEVRVSGEHGFWAT